MGSKVGLYIIALENLKILEFTLPSAKQQRYFYFQLQGDVLNMLHVRPWPMLLQLPEAGTHPWWPPRTCLPLLIVLQ